MNKGIYNKGISIKGIAMLCCQVDGFIHNLWIFGAENCLWMDQGQMWIFLLSN